MIPDHLDTLYYSYLREAYSLGHKSYDRYLPLCERVPRRILRRSLRDLGHKILRNRLFVGPALWDKFWVEGFEAAERGEWFAAPRTAKAEVEK